MRKLVAVRLSDEEREVLEGAAVIRRLPLSGFIREAALAMAGVELAERRLEEAKEARDEAAEYVAEPVEPEPRPSSMPWWIKEAYGIPTTGETAHEYLVRTGQR